MNNTLSRNNTVTIAKAIGIVLVVMAHAMNPEWISWKVIYTFHMPLFFLLSGYCFNEKYLDDARLFFVRKIKGIYVPFVVYSLVFLSLHNVFCKWHVLEADSVFGWRDFVWVVGRIVTRMSHDECLLGTFWFLKELFLGNVFFYIVLRLLKRNKTMTVVVLFLITVLFVITGWRIPYFGIGKTTFYASTFIAFGCFCREYISAFRKWWCYVVAIASVAIYISCFDHVAMGGQTIVTLVPYTVCALGGSLVVFAISDRLNGIFHSEAALCIGGVQFVGNQTLKIMALHFLSFKLVTFLLIKVYALPIDRLVAHPVMMEYSEKGWWLLYTLTGVALPLLFAKMSEIVLQFIQKCYGNRKPR